MDFKELISNIGCAIEGVGVLVIMIRIAISSLRFLSNSWKQPEGTVTLHLEVEGRWPWQQAREGDAT